MPVPATSTSYLPVLLVSVQHNAVPDDTSFSTLPDGQVDYLSHEWREEDVWRSWRNMTRQKNAIANGMRLENASWRTWWKQRNKLKTVSPETLNWLKDSDVTWLYGPLHIGSDWTPDSHVPELHTPQRQGSTEVISSRRLAAPMKKPILKRRSISQLLSLPGGHWFDQGDASDEEAAEHAHGDDDLPFVPERPPLLHTKSDTHLSWRGRPFRKDSPPRIIAEDVPTPSQAVASVAFASTAAETSSDVSNSTGSDPDLSGSSSTGAEGSGLPSALTEGGGVGGKKKHISFNTFVEQCIAIEKPKKRPSISGGREPRVASFDDGYEEDSELGYDELNEPSTFYVGNRAGANSDSEDEDDDVLEMRTPSSRSRSSPGIQRYTAGAEESLLSPGFRPPLVRRSSASERGVTIAPIAPTILKSTGVGNNLVNLTRGVRHVPKDVELVYVPPSNSNYSLPGTPNIADEDVYHHRESYFSVGTGDVPSQPSSAGSSPRIPNAAVLPPPPHISIALPAHRGASRVASSPSLLHRPMTDSPMSMDHAGDAGMEDAYQYFPDLDEDFSEWTPLHEGRGRGMSEAREDGSTSVLRYAEGGAASVTNGRSSGGDRERIPHSPRLSPEMPVVVVNEMNGATEERTERSRESSPNHADVSGGGASYPRVSETQDYPPGLPTFVHSSPSTPAVPVPRIGVSHPHISFSSQVANATLLSPTDVGSFRGRQPACSSVSGSTTTGSSYSRSTDSRSESRGRSLTRNSSCSDHERSGSRSSRGTNSPLGSISPTGSSLGLGPSNSGPARGGRSGARSGRKSSDDVERGRERSGRRLGDSVSPPSLLNSPSSTANDSSDSQSCSPVLAADQPLASSPPLSISGSSTASVSTIGPSKPQQNVQPEIATPRPRITVGSSSMPSIPYPIAEEEEQRSRNPTPASSPISAMHPIAAYPRSEKPKLPEESLLSPASPSRASTDSPTTPTRHKARGSLDLGQDQGTLVGQMVTSARGFLGAIWNAGAA